MKRTLIAVMLLIASLAVPSHGGINEWSLSLPTPRQEWGENSVAIHPTDSGVAYAVTPAGVFKTADRGRRWELVDAFMNASAVAINPRNGSVVLTGNRAFHTGRAQLRRSEDGGATWRDSGSFESTYMVTALTFDRFQPENVYAALLAGGIAMSADSGKTWTISSEGLTCCLLEHNHTEDVATGGITPTIYAASTQLFASTDGARSWQSIGPHETFRAWNVSADPADPARIYTTGTFYPGDPRAKAAFTSSDGGKTWHRLPPLTGVGRIEVDPSDSMTLYLGTTWPPEDSILRSTDRGATWTRFTDGLTDLHVSAIRVDPTGSLLYAATRVGIFVREVRHSVEPIQRLPRDAARLPRLIGQLLAGTGTTTTATSENASSSGFILPAVGRVIGASGVVFRTDVTLSNSRSNEQDVVVAWLPQGNAGGSDVQMFSITLPGFSDDKSGMFTFADIANELGLEGLGSMVVIAVDVTGDVDEGGAIEGFARVRSASSCAGWLSQSLPAVPSQTFGAHRRARALGLRHDAGHRTNVGIVNLGETARTFTVVVDGQRPAERFTVWVPPFSSVQTAIPNRNYGAVSVTVVSDGGPWVAYGSSVDNASGDAWASVTLPLPDR